MPRYDVDVEPYLRREFEIYKFWRILTCRVPGDLRRFPSRIRNDSLLIEKLKRIRTQAEFAKQFGIKDPGTLSDWNMRIDNPMRFANKHLYGTEVHRIRAAAARAKTLERRRGKGKLKDARRGIAAEKLRLPDQGREPMRSRPYEPYTEEMRRGDSFE